MKILVTGAAGFIGFHLSKRLLEMGYEVVGLDNINDYYDVRLKYGRLEQLGIPKYSVESDRIVSSSTHESFRFIKMDLASPDILKFFKVEKFDKVVNLAAQAGVRYSLENPQAYIQSNIVGFTNILEGCRHSGVEHLLYASSSSVYGLNETMPFSVNHNVDHPVSLYAASKKSNELMAHTYSHLYNLSTTGLRFFTVYGPWGRPDMALFLFTKAILAGEPIRVFNEGNMRRDFTYIDDIVTGIVKCTTKPPKGNPEWSGKNPDPSTSPAPYKVYNIGNSHPESLMGFIEAIEDELGMKAIKNLEPIQPGDVAATSADVSGLMEDFGYKPDTDIRTGIGEFVKWYKEFYKIESNA